MSMSDRLARMGGATGEKYAGVTVREKGRPVWNDVVRLHEPSLSAPFGWYGRQLVFVNSMSDLFHEALPTSAIDRVFATMALAAEHTYQVLTKRADRMEAYLNDPETEHRVRLQAGLIDPTGNNGPWPLHNVWVGVSVEDQERADERIPRLLAAPAHVRFLSAEPLWKPVKLELSAKSAELRPIVGGQGIHWLIAGGESGSRGRPMHPDWAISLRDECAELGISFFYKQAGRWSSIQPKEARQSIGLMADGGEVPVGTPGSVTLWSVGKKAAGKLLDGKVYQQWPAGYVAPTIKPRTKRSVRGRGVSGGTQNAQP